MGADHPSRKQQREATDRFIAALREGMQRLEALTDELNRAREVDGEVRSLLPDGETGDTIREWLDSHDRIADELQATTDELAKVLDEGAGQVAATEVYLHEVLPQPDDPRGLT